jgi:hypothetical protein
MPKKSCQLDPLPASLFFQCIDELLPTITNIMNTSLSTGVVPQCFKHALVIPLLKKSNLDPENLKNYRPVSNLPFLSKVLERIVLKQLLTHLENHNLFESLQSAYKKLHSTETAIVRVVNDLLQACDRGEVSILSLLDLSAAFDTIDHQILCSRLNQTFGCSGTVLQWFNSYLTNRTQSVVIDKAHSTPCVLKYGVPQGSVLGPVLFTMYIQPLGSILKNSSHHYHFFADDSQLHNSTQPSNLHNLSTNISSCIQQVATWMKSNKLKMNDDKTEIISIGSKTKLPQASVNSMSFSSCTIPFSDSVRNLGAYLDKHLTIDTHVNQLCKSLFFQLRRISKIRQYLTIEAANTLANSFILSRLDYCNSILSGISEEKLNKLQRIQNLAARIVLRRPRHESASALLRTLHWLPVRARIEYKISILCFQCINSPDFPTYLSELVQIYRPSRELRSLDALLLQVPKYKLSTYGKRSFMIFGPTTWNSLPVKLRHIQSLPTFKKHLKTYLFQKYMDN